MNKVNFLVYKWQDGRQFFISPVHGRPGGNAYGYKTGASFARKALEMQGYALDIDADIYFHYVAPHFFTPIKNRFNVLFTMWECEDMPEDLHGVFSKPGDMPELIIVPSETSRIAIEKIPNHAPVVLCKHGIDTSFYGYSLRDTLSKPVTFLWVGSPNLRKGYDTLTRVWYKLFKNTDDDVLLYMKSSLFKSKGKFERWTKYKAIMDTRNFTSDEMRALYWKAHVFLFPSRGEGVGLPPLEAMSTGLPVLAPPWSGMKDYMLPDHSYPLNYYMVEADYGCETEVAEVEEEYFGDTIQYVLAHLDEAHTKGARASQFVEDHFSLQVFGMRLSAILEGINV